MRGNDDHGHHRNDVETNQAHDQDRPEQIAARAGGIGCHFFGVRQFIAAFPSFPSWSAVTTTAFRQVGRKAAAKRR